MGRRLTKAVRYMKEPDGLRGKVPSMHEGSRDKVYAAYLDTLNPRGNELMQLGLAASTDVRFRAFLEKVMDPRYLRVSFATMAKSCGISLLEFQQWYTNVTKQHAIAEAQLASPDLVGDMITDSRSRSDVCDRCDGLGTVSAPAHGNPSKIPGYRLVKKAEGEMEAIYSRTCPRCKGDGKVRRSGDTHARDRVLEIAGLRESAKGASVVLNFGGASHSSAVAILDDAMSIDPAPTVDSHAEDLD